MFIGDELMGYELSGYYEGIVEKVSEHLRLVKIVLKPSTDPLSLPKSGSTFVWGTDQRGNGGRQTHISLNSRVLEDQSCRG